MFENTLGDLKECFDRGIDSIKSEHEKKAAIRLIQLCREFSEFYDEEDVI